jgi:hypothetical protein
MRGSARHFWFVLALALHMPVAEAQERISSSEFSEWQAFYGIEPFGEQRADLRSGIIACTIGSVFSESNTDLSPADFMPFAGVEPSASAPGSKGEPPEPGSDEEFRLLMDAMDAVPRNEVPGPGSREETMAFLGAMNATRVDRKEPSHE